MLAQRVREQPLDFDTVFARLGDSDRAQAARIALDRARSGEVQTQSMADYSYDVNRSLRIHKLERHKKFTLSLACLIFFFIGAPLGAIIRKGGMGVPVIISVLVFIIYYIFENSGMRMARADEWTVWFGKLISTMALAPVAIFFTYKANNDSVVFNIDLYKELIRRIFGLRTKRNIMRKEVIIEDPKYLNDAAVLEEINASIAQYTEEHHLLHLPNPIKVFFKYSDDHEIERIDEKLESTIEDLGYTRDRLVLTELNNYPILMTRAHTRPFNRKWMNIITAIILPLGVFFYLRMWRFRLRLYKDLHDIRQTNNKIIPKVIELGHI
jgi:lipopolysaccharide export system permease protein